MRALHYLTGLLLLVLAGTGCSYYSFTGASLPSHLSTIAIPLVEDNTASPVPTLDQELTSLFIDRFVNQTRLRIEPSEPDADVLLQGTIQRYTNEPAAVSGGEVAQQNRVTITVAVIYMDQARDSLLLDRSFSGFENYDPVADGLQGEEIAAQTALEAIAEDVFTAATSNW